MEIQTEPSIVLLFLHTEKLFLQRSLYLSLLMTFHQGRNSRKKGRLASLERQCLGRHPMCHACPSTACHTSPGQGQGFYWQRSHCSDTGTKPTQRVTEYGITFSKQHKMCVLSLQTPRSYSPLRAPDPSSYKHLHYAGKHPAELQSAPVLPMLARKGRDSTPQAQSQVLLRFASE